MPKTTAGNRPPSTIATIAPNPAPALTPTKPGSASGLRNRPCITAPDTASDAPTEMPSSNRGRRMSHNTICSIRLSGSPTASFCSAPQSDVPEAPKARLIRAVITREAASTSCVRRAVARRSRNAAACMNAMSQPPYSAARRSVTAAAVRGPKPSR